MQPENLITRSNSQPRLIPAVGAGDLGLREERERAHTICQYRFERGYLISLRLEFVCRTAGAVGIWATRSDLINGWPRQRLGATRGREIEVQSQMQRARSGIEPFAELTPVGETEARASYSASRPRATLGEGSETTMRRPAKLGH